MEKETDYRKMSDELALEVKRLQEYADQCNQRYLNECEKNKKLREKHMEKTIYELELHESVGLNSGIAIIRVPGGWIYDYWDYEKQITKPGTFVPFNNEFQQVDSGINTQLPDYMKHPDLPSLT